MRKIYVDWGFRRSAGGLSGGDCDAILDATLAIHAGVVEREHGDVVRVDLAESARCHHSEDGGMHRVDVAFEVFEAEVEAPRKAPRIENGDDLRLRVVHVGDETEHDVQGSLRVPFDAIGVGGPADLDDALAALDELARHDEVHVAAPRPRPRC